MERTSTDPFYTVLPILNVKVVTGTTSVSYSATTINCAKGGSSEPIVVSVAVAPYTAKGATDKGLTVTLAKVDKAKDAKKEDPEPSAGVSGYGSLDLAVGAT